MDSTNEPYNGFNTQQSDSIYASTVALKNHEIHTIARNVQHESTIRQFCKDLHVSIMLNSAPLLCNGGTPGETVFGAILWFAYTKAS